MYAIVDLETTGGHPETDRIIEISIYVHDGNTITEAFTSLVNPQCPIPWFISKLTKITSEMVQSAPLFSEIAHRVAEVLKGRVFVAHNVMFDYSFLAHSLSREGIQHESQLLCTCKTSRKLLPGHPSYSLSKLCRSLSIKLEGAHRAAADARATAEILHMLMDRTGGELEPFYYVHEKKVNRSAIPDEQVQNLPAKPGVLYFLDENNQVLYLAKSKNIHKKAWYIISRFGNHRYAAIASLSVKLDYILTGSQLLASIRESEEIRTLSPKFNRKFNSIESRFSIYENLNNKGYLVLDTGVYEKDKQPVVTFSSAKEATTVLTAVLIEHGLLPARELDKSGGLLFEENRDEYNTRVSEAIKNLHRHRKNFLVTDHGPEPGQLSVVVIQNGLYSGYLYADRQEQFQDVKEVLERMHHSEDHPSSIKSIIRHVSQGHYRDIIHF